ncbi:MAG: tetratricopeptide (TPR) repeat protein [Myxococcota bacterium]|jgi:tetratricopeptide (TPR) repeat protein
MSVGCDAKTVPATAVPEGQMQRYDQPTTDGAVAVGNLNAQILGLSDAVAAGSTSLSIRRQLMALLMVRTQFLGSFDDFAHALSLAPTDADRATVLIAVHRFEEARALTDDRDAQATIDLATGSQLGALLSARIDAADAHPNYRTLTQLAAAEAASGLFEDADATYVRALEGYGNVSPFAVAFVQFQRGVMWAESAAVPERGLRLYRDAVRILPQYVVATVHLAELESRFGDDATAVRLLDRLIGDDGVGDAEPYGLLSSLLETLDPTRSAGLAAHATTRYNTLLDRHYEAFLDHGAEFFGGPGADSARALVLAQDNLTLRRVDRAYFVAINAAENADRPELACRFAREAGTDRVSIVLNQRIAALSCTADTQ